MIYTMAKKPTTKKMKATAAPRLTALTPEEMAALAPFECNMRTAINSNYSRSIGIGGAKILNGVLKARGLATEPSAGTCVDCTLRLLKTVGRMYFEAKEAQASQE